MEQSLKIYFHNPNVTEEEFRQIVRAGREFVIENKFKCTEIVDDELEWIHEGYHFTKTEDMNFFLLLYGNHYRIDR